MDRMKTNKEMMPTVKKGLLIGILLMGGCATSLPLHQVIKGSFYQENSPVGIGQTYKFEDYSFIDITSMHMGIQRRSKGTYDITEDTLILDYEPMNGSGSSTYRIISREPIMSHRQDNSNSQEDTLGSVNFRTVDRKGKPIRSTEVVARNRKEKTIRTYRADSLGKGPKQIITDKVHDFRFLFIGRHPVTIPADTLSGYHTEVEVMLTGITYSQFDGTKKLLIKEVEKNRIVLQRLEDNRRMVLVREGTEE